MRTRHDATVSRERSAGCCAVRTGEELSDVSPAMRHSEADDQRGARSPQIWGQHPVSTVRAGSWRGLLGPSHATQATDYLNPIQVRGLAAKTRTTATGPSPRLSPSDYSVRPAELRVGTTRIVGPHVFTRQRGQARSIHRSHESLLDHSPTRGRMSTYSLDSLRDA